MSRLPPQQSPLDERLDKIDGAIVDAATQLVSRIERGFTVTIVRRFENKEIETSVQVMPALKGGG